MKTILEDVPYSKTSSEVQATLNCCTTDVNCQVPFVFTKHDPELLLENTSFRELRDAHQVKHTLCCGQGSGFDSQHQVGTL